MYIVITMTTCEYPLYLKVFTFFAGRYGFYNIVHYNKVKVREKKIHNFLIILN